VRFAAITLCVVASQRVFIIIIIIIIIIVYFVIDSVRELLDTPSYVKKGARNQMKQGAEAMSMKFDVKYRLNCENCNNKSRKEVLRFLKTCISIAQNVTTFIL
jgi:hypothetical protein